MCFNASPQIPAGLDDPAYAESLDVPGALWLTSSYQLDLECSTVRQPTKHNCTPPVTMDPDNESDK